jgi:hypothetical protein
MTVVKRPHSLTMLLYILPYGVKCSFPHWKKTVAGNELLVGPCWRMCYIYFRTKFDEKWCHSVTYLFECSGTRLESLLACISCQVALIYSIPKCLNVNRLFCLWSLQVTYCLFGWRSCLRLDVRGSVHCNIKFIERTNKMQRCSRIYYSTVS